MQLYALLLNRRNGFRLHHVMLSIRHNDRIYQSFNLETDNN